MTGYTLSRELQSTYCIMELKSSKAQVFIQTPLHVDIMVETKITYESTNLTYHTNKVHFLVRSQSKTTQQELTLDKNHCCTPKTIQHNKHNEVAYRMSKTIVPNKSNSSTDL